MLVRRRDPACFIKSGYTSDCIVSHDRAIVSAVYDFANKVNDIRRSVYCRDTACPFVGTDICMVLTVFYSAMVLQRAAVQTVKDQDPSFATVLSSPDLHGSPMPGPATAI